MDSVVKSSDRARKGTADDCGTHPAQESLPPSRDMPLGYRDAGVDIDASAEFVRRLRPLAEATRRPESIDSLGGFCSLFALPSGYQNPVLVAGADGVGTKLLLARQHGRLDAIGRDLVAMCANDVATSGAELLFFLDYFAAGKLLPDEAIAVLGGVAAACGELGCALAGGETAEMPGLYRNTDFDVAGFCVGVAERSQLLGRHRPQAGDILLGIASSGPHANGFSLVRALLDDNTGRGADAPLEQLLQPTQLYANALRSLAQEQQIEAAAHITGGGLIENLPRILQPGLRAVVHTNSWVWPESFQWLRKAACLSGDQGEQEMYRTFNCGVGMVLCVKQEQAGKVLQRLQQELGCPDAWPLGTVEQCPVGTPQIAFKAEQPAA